MRRVQADWIEGSKFVATNEEGTKVTYGYPQSAGRFRRGADTG